MLGAKPRKAKTMKMKFAAIAAALLALVSMAPSALAQASSGTISTKGPYAEADIYSTDASGIYREIYVYSSTATTKQPGGPPAGSAVTYAYYIISDTNTGAFDEGFGYINGTLTEGKKFSSASLVASGTLVSFFDGSAHAADLSLDFTPSGPAENVSYVEHISFGTLKFVFKFAGTFVRASLGGSASLDGVGLDSEFFADFGSTKSSSLTISK